jgi:hypothetical protein
LQGNKFRGGRLGSENLKLFLKNGIHKNYSNDSDHEVAYNALEVSLMTVVKHGAALKNPEGPFKLEARELQCMVQHEDAAETAELVLREGENLMKPLHEGGLGFADGDVVRLMTSDLCGASRAETLAALLKHGLKARQEPWKLGADELFDLASQGLAPAVLPKIIAHGRAMFRYEAEGGLGVDVDECIHILLHPATSHADLPELNAREATRDALLARIKNFPGA